ncbi:MAG: flagellar hook-length control protein FliK [Pseudomonadota bacterium]
MIPMILAEPATGSEKPVAKTDATADDAEATPFGDLMTDAEAPDGDASQTATANADGVSVDTEAETAELAAPLADRKLAEGETKPSGALLTDGQKTARPGNEKTPVLPETGKAKPDARAQVPADAAEAAVVKGRAPNTAEKPDLPTPDTKVQRSSVAQSVMEGKLPQASTPVAPKADPATVPASATPRADVERPLPPAAQPAAQPAQQLSPNQDDVAKKLIAQPTVETPKQRREELAQTPVLSSASKPATPIAAATQPPAVALAPVAAQPLRDTGEKLAKASLSEVTITSAPVERQGVATATAQAAPTTAATPETARQVASQIAVAVNNIPGKTTEIALNPEELGRVRLSLSAADGAIVLNVLAERPETQDLLRRNMDLLAQEFRQLGYTSISFSFGDQNADARAEDTQPGETAEFDVKDTAETPAIVTQAQTSGLDLLI